MQYFRDFVAFGIQGKKNNRNSLKNICFFCFLCFICVSYFACFSASGAERTSKDLLEASIQSIMSQKTIECNMRLAVSIDGTQFPARGRYEEQKLPQPLGAFQQSVFRHDINFPMEMPSVPGAEANRMMIVCYCSQDRQNGRVWIYKSIEGEKTLEFIKLAALEEAIARSNRQRLFPTASATRKLGGLAGTLNELETLYDFDSIPEKAVLQGMDKMAVWKLTGTLKDEHFNRLLDEMGGLQKKGRYPGELPTDLEICIGRDDFFPCRIRYMNRSSAASLPETVLAETVYFDIVLNGEEIPEYRFTAFKQDGIFSFQDTTVPFIHSLGLQ